MTYDLNAERQRERDWCVDLVAKSAGWDDYTLDRAAKLAKADPLLHRDLPKAVRAAIDARKVAL